VRQVRKAVIPVAGLGTRFLPITKTIPKELLLLVDKPLVQYAVEEAVASGIEEIIFVTNPGKHTVENYFRPDVRLEALLRRRGRRRELQAVRRVGRLARIRTVVQPEPCGLGHAIACARRAVGREPFAVLLPDEIIDARVPCTRQLLRAQARTGGCVIATEEARRRELSAYGVLDVRGARGRLLRVDRLVEKPRPKTAPSRFVVVGRYVLTPEVFDALERTRPGRGGEIQLTDALDALAARSRVSAWRFQGTRLDAGTLPGLLRATVHFARKEPGLYSLPTRKR
jgi:UTP--glucose-1-phosphate uridylyltransferase